MSTTPAARNRIPLLIAVAIVAVYVWFLRAPFVLDDLSKIVNNLDLRDAYSLVSNLFARYEGPRLLERNDPSRPLTFFIYGLIYAIDGADPMWFHLTSLGVHAACALLAFGVARRYLDDTMAALAVAFWALNPFTAGTVLYAYGLSDQLALLFSLLLVRELLNDAPSTTNVVRRTLGGLLSKQSFVATPLWAGLVLKPGTVRRRAWMIALATTAGWLVARRLYLGGWGDLEGRNDVIAFGSYLPRQGALLWRYFTDFWVPRQLSIDHYVTLADVSVAWGCVGWLAIVGLSAAALRHVQRRRSVASVGVALGWLWFIAQLLPTSSVMPTVDLYVERRAYAATLGLALGLASLLPRRAWTLPLLAAATLAAGAGTLRRGADHDNVHRLYESILRIYPDSLRALNNLALVDMREHKTEDARILFEKILRDHPNDAYAHANLGSLYVDLQDAPNAELHLKRALEIDPSFAGAAYNLGRLYQLTGHDNAAVPLYQQALSANPRHFEAWNNLGVYYLNHGDLTAAETHFRQSLRLNPQYAPARDNLARIQRGAPAPSPGANANEVPVQNVPMDVLIDTYRKHLSVNPRDEKARGAYRKLCKERHVECPPL